MNEAAPETAGKRQELLLFLFVTLVLFPVLTMCLIGGYGLLVWIYQVIAGPPGPPA